MKITEAIQFILGREVDFINEIKILSDENGTRIFEWNAPEDQPSSETINNLLTKCVKDGVSTCTCNILSCQKKVKKIAELNKLLIKNIEAGFYSDAKNGTKFYDFDEQAQINIMGKAQDITLGNTSIYWKASNELVPYEWDVLEFQALYHDAVVSKETKTMAFLTIIGQVMACTTQEQLDAIEWTWLNI